MSLPNDALDYVIGVLEAASIPATADPRTIRLPGLLVDPPTIVARSATLVECTFPIIAVAGAPGDLVALRRLLDLVDAVIALPDLASTSANPGTYSTPSGELPSYSLSVVVTMQRS